MSFVVANTELVSGAAEELAHIGSMINAVNSAAAAQTTGVLAAGADEVSATIAVLFGAHGQAYQALSAQAAAFHQQFVQLMSDGAAQYASAEAANANPFQAALDVINAPTPALVNRPLIGNDTNGTEANPNGGAGRLLIGNGGNGLSSSTAGVSGGVAGLIGNGGVEGAGGFGAAGGRGGTGGLLFGNAGAGGNGFFGGGNGGRALLLGNGGGGGASYSSELAGNGGNAGLLAGIGGTGLSNAAGGIGGNGGLFTNGGAGGLGTGGNGGQPGGTGGKGGLLLGQPGTNS